MSSSSPPRAAGRCAQLPRCFGSLGASNVGCVLPYNVPGVPDALRSAQSLLPAVQVPPAGDAQCSGTASASLRPLVIWRSRWPYNFMEFTSRVLAAAPDLLAAQGGRLLVPGLPTAPPAFYHDLLDGLLEVEAGTRVKLHGHSFSSASLCCLNGRGDINRSAAREFVAQLLRRRGVLVRPRPLPAGSASHRRHESIAIVDRAAEDGRSPTGAYNSSRSIRTAAALLEGCRRAEEAAAGCAPIRFPPASTFKAALSQLQLTSVLVGMHGAGLVHVVFMAEGSTLVEVFPAAFAALPKGIGFGLDHYRFIRSLGYRHAQLAARETARACVVRARGFARGVAERLRDCDVDLAWDAVAAAIRAPSLLPLRGSTRYACTVWPPGGSGSDEARCLHGNTLRDGFRYIHNAGRGMSHAACGAHAQCACCRAPS